jgi:hypothetical protein
MKYSHRYVLFAGTSANSSTYTSSPILWADYEQGSVEWADGGNSELTIQGCNEDGFSASLVTWSNLTGITSAGLYTVDPGPRWIRALRNSADSLSQVFVQARS